MSGLCQHDVSIQEFLRRFLLVAFAALPQMAGAGDNIIKQTKSLKVEMPPLLPGIKVHVDPNNVTPIRQIQMARFDGKSWVLFGDVLGEK